MQSVQAAVDGESGDERQDADSLKADCRGCRDAISSTLKADSRGWVIIDGSEKRKRRKKLLSFELRVNDH